MLQAGLRFNPYRVFSSAETRLLSLTPSAHISFNPYRVFSSAETTLPAPVQALKGHGPFQSLSGFLIS